MWAVSTFVYGTFGSYRIPDQSSQFSFSSPVPGPSAFKLALTSARIQETCMVEEGVSLFDEIKNSTVAYRLPLKFSSFQCFLKRLKQKKSSEEDSKKDAEDGSESMQSTYGIRGLIHYLEPLSIAIEVENDGLEIAMSAAQNIRYLGTNESLVTCVATKKLDKLDEKEWVFPSVRPSANGNADFLSVKLKDFNEGTEFSRISRYRTGNSRAGRREIHKTIYYFFPVKSRNFVGPGIVYELN